MKREFSFYEFAGILIPGATLLLGLSMIFVPLKEFLQNEKFSLGELGLFVIASYVVGHLVQAVGNILEKVVWAFRGMPTTWIIRKKPPFLSDAQLATLHTAIPIILGHNIPKFTDMDRRTCDGIRGQLYARLEQAERTGRIDTFNGNYGMFRGIASSLLIVLIVSYFKNGFFHCGTYILAIALGLSLVRMHRFGVHYASELYRQTLNLHANPNPTAK